MTEERIDIVVTDKVASTIATKFNEAATAAETLDTHVVKLKSSLSNFNASAITGLNTAIKGSQTALSGLAKQAASTGTSMSNLGRVSSGATAGITSLTTSLVKASVVAATTGQGLSSYATATTKAGSSSASASKQVESLSTAMTRVSGAAAQASSAQTQFGSSLEKTNASMGKATGGATGLSTALQGISVAALGISTLKAAETYASMAGKLSVVSDNSGDAANALDKLYKVANDTNSAIDSSSDLYFKLALNNKKLGEDSDRLAGFVEKVNRAAQLTRPSSQQAASGILQFSQAMGKGVLNGDELTSILENIPGLGKAIADGMGVPIGQLKELGAQGKLTAEDIFRAVEKSAPQIGELYAKLPVSVSQSLQTFTDAFVRQIGITDQAYGVTSFLAKGIKSLAQEMPTIIKHVTALATAIGGLLVINLVTKGVLAFNAAIRANPIGAILTGLVYLITLAIQYRNELGLTDERLKTLWETLKIVFQGAVTVIAGALQGIKDFVAAVYAVGSAIGTFFAEVWTTVTTAATTALNNIKTVATSFGQLVAAIWDRLAQSSIKTWNYITTTASTAINLMISWFNILANAWRSSVELVQVAAQTTWERITSWALSSYEKITDSGTALIKFFVDLWKKVSDTAKKAWEFVVKTLNDAIDSIKSAFDSAVSSISSFFQSIISWAEKAMAAVRELLSLQASAGGSEGVETRAKGGPTKQAKLYLTGEKGPELYRSNDGSRQIILGSGGPQMFKPPKDGYVYNATDTARMLSNGAIPRSLPASEENRKAAQAAVPRANGGGVTSDSSGGSGGRQFSFSPANNVPKGFEDVLGATGYYPIRNNATGALTLSQLPPYFLPDTVKAVDFQLNEATSFAKALNGEASKVMAKVAEEYSVTKVFGSPARYSEALMIIEGQGRNNGTGGLLAGLQGEPGRLFTRSGDPPVWVFPDLIVNPKDIEEVNKLKGTPREQLSQVVETFKGVSTKQFTTSDLLTRQFDDARKAALAGKTGQDVPAFRNGGNFRVGGKAGIDQNLVQFRASKGEEVIVNRRPNDQSGQSDSISTNTVINNYGVKDAADAYGRNKGQIERDQERNIRRAKERR